MSGSQVRPGGPSTRPASCSASGRLKMKASSFQEPLSIGPAGHDGGGSGNQRTHVLRPFKMHRRKSKTRLVITDLQSRGSSSGNRKSLSFLQIVSLTLLFISTCCLLRGPESAILRFCTCDDVAARTSQASDGGGPVKITIQPNDLIAIEGESAELNCDAEGEPEPTIEWYHNGQLIKSSTNSRTTMGGSIQFLDIRPNTPTTPIAQQQQQSSSSSSSSSSLAPSSDAGVYHCVARNQFGLARSRNASLQVAYIKERFKVAPRDKLAAVGETASFECLPQAWPEPQIQWRRNGRLIDPEEVRLPDGSAKFTINRIARTDLNMLAAGEGGAHHRAITPNGAETLMRGGGVANGQQQQQHAFASEVPHHNNPLAAGFAARPPPVGGSHNNNNNNNDNDDNSGQVQLVDVFGSQLVIRQVDKGDEARYSCVVETKGSHRLIERESPSAQLTAYVKPYFVEAPEHRSAQVGSQVRIRCRMGGEPDPVISWRRQNGQPLSEKTMIDPNDKTLIIDGLRVTDQGVYICEGENAVGSARALAHVTVSSRPKFIQQPMDQTAELGSRVLLKCSGEASPPPMLFWYKEGHRQLMFPSPPPSSQNNLRSPQQQQHWPQAAALSSMMPTPTTSDTSPAINRLFSMPIGQIDHTAQAVYSNSNYFGNRIYVDNQGALNIVNVTASDNGYYACALVSSVGSVMAKAKLTVKPSPNSPYSASSDFYSDPLQARSGGLSSMGGKYELLPPPVIKMGSANQTLPTNTSTKLYCDVVSQVAYKIQWFFDSQPLQEDPPRITVLEDGNLGINNLRISDTGLYTCVVTAANDQNMPVASPFEPLEPSMLTLPPPVQQSTAHSCMLKVGNPTNPNIQFFRMDILAYPSPPGAPYMVSTNGDDAITIAWAPPGDSGVLPVKQYVVEHYDTSQEHLGWRVIHRLNGKESLLIDGLSPEGSHFFVVRATNSQGTGPSSAIAGPMRTVAGENRYQLEQQRRRNPTGLDFADTRPDTSLARDRLMTVVTNLLSLNPVGPTSIKLQWSTQSTGNSTFSPYNSLAVGDYLEGYSIRYRISGIGESLLSKDPLFGMGANQFDPKIPASLPLVTSFVDEEETIAIPSRSKRDLASYYDLSTEFNEVRITDHNVEHYTINGLRPFTSYQFFVVPYYKDIDGVPSNILTAQTNEDRPSIAPSVLFVRPINNTAIRLIWPHIPTAYANGVIRGYIMRINQSDTTLPRILNLPMAGLVVAPSATLNPESKIQPIASSLQQYVVMYDITNLNHNSFYSIQVAGVTSVGAGPWSEAFNFIMDFKKIADTIKATSGNALDDIMSQSFLSTIPNSLDGPSSNSQGYLSSFVLVPVILITILILLLAGFVLYRRNNQQVITWKKTISEHFTNKFYLPSSVDHDHHREPGSLQQNIYDHQHHLIYSAGSTHMAPHQAIPSQTMWAGINSAGAGCINSSGTGSLSSHGGLLPINNDPNSMRAIRANDQVLINKDINSRYIRGNNGAFCQMGGADSAHQGMGQQQQQQPHQQIIHHGGDYYSVMNNVAEYEELDQQQRHVGGAMQIGASSVVERHQTGSSNSDTSCPSSVTRLLPNQNYNRGLLEQQQRNDMILQQQIGCNGDIKQPIITMINGGGGGSMVDAGKFQQPKSGLSPYATTNLMNQLGGHQPQQSHQAHIFANPQMNIINQQQQRLQQNFVLHNGNSTMDDASKILMAQQMNGGQGPNAATSFRTLQRHPNNLQPAVAHSQPTQLQQIFMQNDLTQQFANNNNSGGGNHHHQSTYVPSQPSFQAHNNIVTNVTANPLVDTKSQMPNFYERIDYDGVPAQQQQQQQAQRHTENISRQQDLISSSTSSGSVKSPTHHPYQADVNGNKHRRNTETEVHDLRVFASANQSATDAERQRLNGGGADREHQGGNAEDNEDELAQADETTAFRRQSCQGDDQRTRQLSKRKKKQQRSRMHHNNQQVL